ncbi:DUF3450 family protein [Persicirhabdus sediminis]|uniref:DUF3450 family protein n=1 Tax=Persicirhabdus sediminis TaxID=454144 RepID=A0A8J7SJG7_9BACT|nr:DUF3450 family protein [Persicirhabdus sediminis]MBK1790150.1 DUF3450 family protein [Persicirhabdus sediminis]
MKKLTVMVLMSVPACLLAQPDAVDENAAKINPVEDREMIRQWVQTEQLASEELASWQTDKANMQELLELYQAELKLLSEEIDQAGQAAALVNEEKQELEADLAEHRDNRRYLAENLVRLQPKLASVAVRFPEPLKTELDADLVALNELSAIDKPREVLQAMIAVISGAARFNRSITIADSIDTVDGKELASKVLYLGLAQAYYVSGNGSNAGTGKPSADGWQWTAKPELAGSIRQAIAIYEREAQPQLTELPLTISK